MQQGWRRQGWCLTRQGAPTAAGSLEGAPVHQPPSLHPSPISQKRPLVHVLSHLSTQRSPTCTWWRQHHLEFGRVSVTLDRWWKFSRVG